MRGVIDRLRNRPVRSDRDRARGARPARTRRAPVCPGTSRSTTPSPRSPRPAPGTATPSSWTAGADHYLFTFSPTGVESFYALPEETASKGVADYLMLRRKLPDEIFAGRRMLPSTLFRRDDVAGYLANLDRALEQTIAELGPAGSVGRLRSHPATRPPDGAGLVGGTRVGRR